MGTKNRIVSSFFIGLLLSFLFASFFLNLFERSLIEQFFLISISTASSAFLIHLGFSARDKGFHFSLDNHKINIWQKLREFGSFILSNIPGLLLTIVFVFIYIYIGSFFNNPLTANTDNYLDADNGPWITLIADPSGYNQEMRVPHPFAFFIFRPLGWFANLIFPNHYISATVLNASFGGMAVLLAWFFAKSQTGDRVYAFLIAALLGLTTSHLVFSSIVKSYIFSATALIGFFLILRIRQGSTPWLISVSLLSFGITITNFIQTLIGYSIIHPRWKKIFFFTGTVISIGVILTLVHAVWYPSSQPFFLISSTQGENAYVFSLFGKDAWEFLGRTLLLARTFLLYSIIAPMPFVLLDEIGGNFPSFQFFKIAKLNSVYLYSEYNGIGNILVIIWILLVMIASVNFLKNLFTTRKLNLSLAFILCLIFNFALHFFYGEDPFLYATNWTYALIFFVFIKSCFPGEKPHYPGYPCPISGHPRLQSMAIYQFYDGCSFSSFRIAKNLPS